MDKKILQALNKSIAKWERNATTYDLWEVTLGILECALCQLFWDRNCKGCPVLEKTGATCCDETPYEHCSVAYRTWKYTWLATTPESWNTLLVGAAFRRAARKEVAFLRSLLPTS